MVSLKATTLHAIWRITMPNRDGTMTMPEVMAELDKSPREGIGWLQFPAGSMGLRDGLRLYLEHGIQAGSGLMSVLEGDLWGAGNSLDADNWKSLKELMMWLYNNPPHIAYGSKEKCAKWMSHSGAEGYDSGE